MTLFTVLLAAIARKVKAVVAEYRILVADAKVVEAKIVTLAKTRAFAIVEAAEAEEARLLAEAKTAIATAVAEEKRLLSVAGAETRVLYDEVINKIAKL